MTGAELDAAGITEPRLRRSYLRCRTLHARHGRTYFLATRLLYPAQRPAIHALYGFARWADDIVDEPDNTDEPERIAARLDEVGRMLFAGLRRGDSEDPVLAAVVHTARRYGIPDRLFTAFLRSMRMDLTTRGYQDRSALNDYVHGSAEVIGLQVLPVLGTVTSHEEAKGPAAALGMAFQLTNFLRDIAEDLDRGRVYLPEDELAAFGVDRELLLWCRQRGRTDPRVRRALADQIATTRAVYRRARPGIAMLHPVSRPCVGTAMTLYSEILDLIEENQHDVFTRRARVGTGRRLTVASGALARAALARATRRAPAAGIGGHA
ncbi:phytoene/squalene synthase family protein [Amycolatopsis marina]|nr:phytoene/squalene synthase family protein [Amycolatopsis marina]